MAEVRCLVLWFIIVLLWLQFSVWASQLNPFEKKPRVMFTGQSMNRRAWGKSNPTRNSTAGKVPIALLHIHWSSRLQSGTTTDGRLNCHAQERDAPGLCPNGVIDLQYFCQGVQAGAFDPSKRLATPRTSSIQETSYNTSDQEPNENPTGIKWTFSQ